MIQDILSADATFIVLKWLILLAIWLFLAFGLHRDSLKIRKFHDASITTAMLQILHRRNLHIFGLVSMLLIVLLANEIQAPAVILPPQAAQVEKAPVTQLKEQETKQAPVVDNTQITVPQSSKIPFSDITEFNEANGKQQAYIDFLKQRYETWLITYYYLQKCGRVATQDLDIIMTALRKGLQTAHADGSVEANIMTAANGSYKEMYKDIPCDEAHIVSTKSGYDSSMRQIKATAAAPALAPAQPVGQGAKQP